MKRICNHNWCKAHNAKQTQAVSFCALDLLADLDLRSDSLVFVCLFVFLFVCLFLLACFCSLAALRERDRKQRKRLLFGSFFNQPSDSPGLLKMPNSAQEMPAPRPPRAKPKSGKPGWVAYNAARRERAKEAKLKFKCTDRLTGKTNPLKIVGMHKEVETKRLKAAAKMLTDAPVPRSPASPSTAPCDANAPLELAVKDKELCR